MTFKKTALKYLGNEVFNAKNDKVKYHKCKGGYHADRKEDQSDFQRLRRRSRAIQETIGISGAQGNILNYILVESQNRSVYQKDIEQEFGLRPSTATETLKSLEKNGLIKRETDPNDGRYKKIVFTEKAEQIEAVLKSEIEESETILLQGVTKEERQEFLRIAEKMLQNLDTFPANTVKKNAGRKKQHGGRTDE